MMKKHTAEPNSLLGHWCDVVADMKPGQKLRVQYYELRPISGFHHNGADFGPVDRILGNIIGSAFTHSYDTDSMTGDIIFACHENTGRRHYVSPDQKQVVIIDEAADIQPEGWSDYKSRFDNLENFRGPSSIPGEDWLASYPEKPE